MTREKATKIVTDFLKDSTPHSRYFSDELGVQTDHVFTCAK